MLAERYYPLAMAVARRTYCVNGRWEDCYDDAVQGLLLAVQRYDACRGKTLRNWVIYRVKAAIHGGNAHRARLRKRRGISESIEAFAVGAEREADGWMDGLLRQWRRRDEQLANVADVMERSSGLALRCLQLRLAGFSMVEIARLIGRHRSTAHQLVRRAGQRREMNSGYAVDHLG
jgi:RNA polymerase sigma factor (sigma-70 family)